MNIIDCRYRPNTPEWMATFTRNPVYAEYVKLTDFDRKPTQSRAACAAQLGSLGIGKALVSGRDIESTYASPSSNGLVDACVAAMPQDVTGMARYCADKVLPAMAAVRTPADKLEQTVDRTLWPLPTYSDMLFYV